MKIGKKTTLYKADTLHWLTCSHCHKIILYGSPDEIKTLKRWKKQPNLKK